MPKATRQIIACAPPELEGCPAELRDLIERCLAKDPATRPAPSDIIGICRAPTVSQAAPIAQAWLPPAMAATVMRYAAPPSLAEPG